jgi:hypothetical protein
MTMESELKRIADALEALAARAPTANPAPPKADPMETKAPPNVPVKPTPERAPEPTTTGPKRGPGRPPKTVPTAPVAEVADVLDEDSGDGLDFLSDPTPEPPATIEAVQKALVALQKRSGNPEKARGVLASAGGGAQTLASLGKEHYAAVIAAANAA